MTEPQPYNMAIPDDRKRWYREMKGYLMNNGSDGTFLQQGTDRTGRKYAWDAFLSIEEEFTRPQQEREQQPPRCIENHHNDDGTLIIFKGETPPSGTIFSGSRARRGTITGTGCDKE